MMAWNSDRYCRDRIGHQVRETCDSQIATLVWEGAQDEIFRHTEIRVGDRLWEVSIKVIVWNIRENRG